MDGFGNSKPEPPTLAKPPDDLGQMPNYWKVVFSVVIASKMN